MAETVNKHLLSSFDQALEALRSDVVLMASIAARCVQNARRGFEERDDDACAGVIADDEEVDLLEKQVDRSGTDVLLRFQPFATDLRLVLATIKVGSQLERLSDYAVIIARRVRKLNELGATSIDGSAISQIFSELESALTEVLAAFADVNLPAAEKVRAQMRPLAERARDADEELSDFVDQYPERSRSYVNLIAIAQGIEQMAFLIENIAEEVVYVCEARDVRHPGNRLEVEERERSE